MFQDRTEAGRRLAQRLISYKTKEPVVIALPRGGVPVAFEVARLLEAPLNILIIRKLGFPGQPDLAIGAIADGDRDLPPRYIESEIQEAVDLLEKETDEVVCLDIPEFFMAVGGFYRDFRPVSTEDIIQFLDEAHEDIRTHRKAV